jgi:hypothetical protein
VKTVCCRLLDRLLPRTNKRFSALQFFSRPYRGNRQVTNGKSDLEPERLLRRLLNQLPRASAALETARRIASSLLGPCRWSDGGGGNLASSFDDGAVLAARRSSGRALTSSDASRRAGPIVGA